MAVQPTPVEGERTLKTPAVASGKEAGGGPTRPPAPVRHLRAMPVTGQHVKAEDLREEVEAAWKAVPEVDANADVVRVRRGGTGGAARSVAEALRRVAAMLQGR